MNFLDQAESVNTLFETPDGTPVGKEFTFAEGENVCFLDDRGGLVPELQENLLASGLVVLREGNWVGDFPINSWDLIDESLVFHEDDAPVANSFVCDGNLPTRKVTSCVSTEEWVRIRVQEIAGEHGMAWEPSEADFDRACEDQYKLSNALRIGDTEFLALMMKGNEKYYWESQLGGKMAVFYLLRTKIGLFNMLHGRRQLPGDTGKYVNPFTMFYPVL